MQRFPFTRLESCDLVVDAVYEGGRSGNAGDDPLPRLIGVINQGGFRYLGSKETPRLIVLTSSFNDPDWPDNLDRETGILTYYGDNKHPGRALHETPRHGNLLLRDLFNAANAQPPRRTDTAPVLIFGNAGSFREMHFLGLAVPGAPQLMDGNFFSFNLTRPSRDGGRDAIGLYRIGHGASAILADFALEAKCYDLSNSVGVREVSRLISRLRHRQFGVLVTTSYLHPQAYREIKEDGHPVVVISARDIVDILALTGMNTPADVVNWLQSDFPQAAFRNPNGAVIDGQQA